MLPKTERRYTERQVDFPDIDSRSTPSEMVDERTDTEVAILSGHATCPDESTPLNIEENPTIPRVSSIVEKVQESELLAPILASPPEDRSRRASQSERKFDTINDESTHRHCLNEERDDEAAEMSSLRRQLESLRVENANLRAQFPPDLRSEEPPLYADVVSKRDA